ncbi:MAG: hypothetical protein KatS3mg009_2068 [Acidimicrobiia bacterium]|nr:MAG: hypothetical protein KatS3mg009_2068 [Acidimicrobiia bacterium]
MLPSGPIGRPCSSAETARSEISFSSSASRYTRASCSRSTGSSAAVRPSPSGVERAASISRRTLSRVPRWSFATVPRSWASVVMATRQPSSTGPRVHSTGTRTSVKNTSLKSRSPVIVVSGRTSMPGRRMSTSRQVMPRCLGASRVGAHEELAPVGEVRQGRPRLLPVDDPVVAVAHGGGAQRREVGACVRLREPLAPDVVAAQHPRQERALLGLGAVRDDRRGDVGQADRVERAGRARPVHLLGVHDLLHHAGAAPAPLLGPGDRGVAGVGERAVPRRAGAPACSGPGRGASRRGARGRRGGSPRATRAAPRGTPPRRAGT